jgi:hypothetical protein
MSDVHNLPPTQLVDESGPPLLLARSSASWQP